MIAPSFSLCDRSKDLGALQISTVGAVGDGMGHTLKSMADCVIVGTCLLHARTWVGFAVGAAMVGLEVCVQMPPLVRVSHHWHITCPLLLLQVLDLVTRPFSKFFLSSLCLRLVILNQ